MSIRWYILQDGQCHCIVVPTIWHAVCNAVEVQLSHLCYLVSYMHYTVKPYLDIIVDGLCCRAKCLVFSTWFWLLYLMWSVLYCIVCFPPWSKDWPSISPRSGSYSPHSWKVQVLAMLSHVSFSCLGYDPSRHLVGIVHVSHPFSVWKCRYWSCFPMSPSLALVIILLDLLLV